MTVVAPVELQQLVPLVYARASRRADIVASVPEFTNLTFSMLGIVGADLLGQSQLWIRGRAEAGPSLRAVDGLDDLGMRVAPG